MFEKVETGIFVSKAPLSGTVQAGRVVRSAHIAKNPETGGLVLGIEQQTRQVFLNLQQAMRAAREPNYLPANETARDHSCSLHPPG